MEPRFLVCPNCSRIAKPNDWRRTQKKFEHFLRCAVQ